ncbi:uncharacterized protein LOC125672973 isoform X2 [Ostrea edulis]|uniref:uncharacterized protein LOC125672973 isoform X2 n=1 Tax=Ostrea edulis TaxID=37623 RepID=UPI0024AF72CF|nr:uncharacterized protein LOC125672973 isoform X2 [Ostrea edulis]XP_048765139.2 uncharacterized protein LOC125672973 isoform X2 [Ostrea edulis]
MKVLRRFEKWMTRIKKGVKAPAVAHIDSVFDEPQYICPVDSRRYIKQQDTSGSGTPSKHKVVESTLASDSVLELNQDVEKLDSTSLKELSVSDFVANDEILDVSYKSEISMESNRNSELPNSCFSSLMESLELSFVDYSVEYESTTSYNSIVDMASIDKNVFIDISKSKAIYDCPSSPRNEQTFRTLPPQPTVCIKLAEKRLNFNYPKHSRTVFQENSSVKSSIYGDRNVLEFHASKTGVVDKYETLEGVDRERPKEVESPSFMKLERGPIVTCEPLCVVNDKEINPPKTNVLVKIDKEASKRERRHRIGESCMTVMMGSILYYYPASSEKIPRIPNSKHHFPIHFKLNDGLHKVTQAEVSDRKVYGCSSGNVSKTVPYSVTSGEMEKMLKGFLLKFEKISPFRNGQTEAIERKKDLFSLSSNFMGTLTSNPTLGMFSKKSRQLVRQILFYSNQVPSVHDAFCTYPLQTSIRQNDSGFTLEDTMRFEWQRLRSFHSYPTTAIGASILRLAQDGFYFTGNGRDTRCFFCHCVYSDWSHDSDLRSTHLRLSPDCPIANRRESSNIPINPSRRREHHQQHINAFHGIDRFDENIAEDSGESLPVARHMEESLASDHSTNTSFLVSHETSLSQNTTANHEVNPIISELSQIQIPRVNFPNYRRRADSEIVSATEVSMFNEEIPQRITPNELRNSRSEQSSIDVSTHRQTEDPPTRSAHRQIQDSQTRSTQRQTQDSPTRSAHRETQNPPTRSTHRETQDPPTRPTHRETQNPPTRSTHRETQDSPTRSAHRETHDPPTRSTHRETQDSPTRSAHRETHDPPTRSTHRETQDSPTRSAHRETHDPPTRSAQSVLTYKQKLSSQLDPLGIVWEKPKFPAYAILTTRASSYEGWPADRTQTPIEMAKAGFFYVGHNDYVRCFFCGGGLKNWERADIPWEEHARWFPRCAFVRNVQGEEYVSIIQRKTQPDDFVPVCGPTGQGLEKQVIVDLLKEEGYPQQRIQSAISMWEHRRDLVGYKLPMKAEDLIEIMEEDNEDHQNRSTPSSQSSTEVQILQTELSSLTSTLLCKVCFTQEVGIAFLPCGHLICCRECGPAVRKCLLCDVIIKGTIKTYFS